MRARVNAVTTGARKASYNVTVDPAKGWIDTQIPLLPGDELTLSATGSLDLSNGHTGTADGVARGWRDMLRSFPLDSGNVGALVGRIGSSPAAVPFLIGSSLQLPVRQAGNLFVRLNLADDLTATGTLRLQVKLGKQTATPASTLPASEIARVLQADVIDGLPRRVSDAEGTPGDVVNFALVGTEQQVRDAFTRAGWVSVDADTDSAIVNGLLSTLQHKAYVAVPMSKLYLFGRPQDMSYARAEAIRVATERHHLRVWRSDATVNGRPLWIGSATYDNGLERDQRNGHVTHSIDPEIDKERDFLRDSFDSAGAVSSAAYVTPRAPVSSANTATGGSFHTDGRVLVMSLE